MLKIILTGIFFELAIMTTSLIDITRALDRICKKMNELEGKDKE